MPRNGAGRTGAIDRREFLRRGAIAGVGVGLAPALPGLAAEAMAEVPRVRRYVPLGRTGLEISDIGFGSSRLEGDPALVHHAIERGINYFDSAESYAGGRSQQTLGEALVGRRDGVVLVSKTQAAASARRDEIMRSLEGSLASLRTDRVEIFLNHAVNDVARMQNEEWGEFVVRAKEQGKIRFSGLSGHGGHLVDCIDWSLDHDLLDVMLVAHNFGQDPTFLERFTKGFDFVAKQPGLPRVLAKAKSKGVGVVAMKTLLGARLNDMRPYEAGGATYAQAAFRWVLSNPHVDALIVTMRSRSMIDEYLGASGARAATHSDALLLDRYLALHGALECRYGCSGCVDACPHGVAISDVLRTRMYAVDYGDREQGREEYARLGQPALVCTSCSGAPCRDACPHELDLHSLTLDAHERLA